VDLGFHPRLYKLKKKNVNRKDTGLTEEKLHRKYSAAGLKLLNALKEFDCAKYNFGVREQDPDEKICTYEGGSNGWLEKITKLGASQIILYTKYS
jgi:hypothetical protein